VRHAFAPQAEVTAEVAREPEVRKAFGNRRIDLTDQKTRLTVWAIMYDVFRKAGTNPLASLMALAGRYLTAFTRHTLFNIRDIGANYINSDMSTDLAGRLVMDCGVFALDVAWDVFNAVKQNKGAEVTFTLATFLDHVTLIISDKSTGDYYLVNNNEITRIERPTGFAPQFRRPSNLPPSADVFLEDPVIVPPQRPALEDEVVKQYASIRDLDYLVTPTNYIEVGSTADTAGTFRDAAWQRYLATTGYMARVPANYLMQKWVSDNAAIFDADLDRLKEGNADQRALETWLKGNWALVTRTWSVLVGLIQAFDKMPQPRTPPAHSHNDVKARWTGGRPHPMVRVALLLLHFKAVGGTLSQDHQLYLRYLDGVPEFKKSLDEHRSDGVAGDF
jgi:hypothetical protein